MLRDVADFTPDASEVNKFEVIEVDLPAVAAAGGGLSSEG
jgi:hypothetical protein